MKKYTIVSLFLTLTAISLIVINYSFNYTNNTLQKTSDRQSNGFAVVELFTSEGCSSCPSADVTVAKLLSKHIDNVYILSYHVDYWNRLGWKDPFSHAAFTARQSQYSRSFSLNTIYTPQVIVNGSSEFVGSNEVKLNTVVENNINNGVRSGLQVETERKDNQLVVHYNISSQEPVLLNMAFVQPEATTSVKSGENSGKTLHHVNIVRALNIVEVKGKGFLTLEIPKQLTAIPLEFIAFTQSKQQLRVLGADSKIL